MINHAVQVIILDCMFLYMYMQEVIYSVAATSMVRSNDTNSVHGMHSFGIYWTLLLGSVHFLLVLFVWSFTLTVVSRLHAVYFFIIYMYVASHCPAIFLSVLGVVGKGFSNKSMRWL